MPARTISSRLHVEPVVDPVDDDLRLALRLHVAAHNSESKPWHTVLSGETGNDGLEGALAGRIDVGVSILKGEELAAILKHEAEAVGDKA